MGNQSKNKNKKAAAAASSAVKITKEERREKYTRLARQRSAQRSLQRNAQKQQLVCFQCRQPGHTIEACPQYRQQQEQLQEHEEGGDKKKKKSKKNTHTTLPVSLKCCYKCGSTEHGLSQCPEKKRNPHDDSLPFAICFVCKAKGHLASACPQNEKGVFVNGDGACRNCGSKRHMSHNCPNPNAKKQTCKNVEDGNDNDGYVYDNEEDLLLAVGNDTKKNVAGSKNMPDGEEQDDNKKMESSSSSSAPLSKKKRRVVNF